MSYSYLALRRRIFTGTNRATLRWDSASTILLRPRRRGHWISWCRRCGYTGISNWASMSMISLSLRSISPPHLIPTSGPFASRPFNNRSRIRWPLLSVSENRYHMCIYYFLNIVFLTINREVRLIFLFNLVIYIQIDYFFNYQNIN